MTGCELRMASLSTNIVWKTQSESLFEPKMISSVFSRKSFDSQSPNQVFDVIQKEQIAESNQRKSNSRNQQQPLLLLADEIDCIARKNIFKGTQHPPMFQHSKIISPNSRKNPSNVSNNIILYSSQYANPTYTEHAYPGNKFVFAYLQENLRLFQPFSNRTLPENQISFANSSSEFS